MTSNITQNLAAMFRNSIAAMKLAGDSALRSETLFRDISAADLIETQKQHGPELDAAFAETLISVGELLLAMNQLSASMWARGIEMKFKLVDAPLVEANLRKMREQQTDSDRK